MANLSGTTCGEFQLVQGVPGPPGTYTGAEAVALVNDGLTSNSLGFWDGNNVPKTAITRPFPQKTVLTTHLPGLSDPGCVLERRSYVVTSTLGKLAGCPSHVIAECRARAVPSSSPAGHSPAGPMDVWVPAVSRPPMAAC